MLKWSSDHTCCFEPPPDNNQCLLSVPSVSRPPRSRHHPRRIYRLSPSQQMPFSPLFARTAQQLTQADVGVVVGLDEVLEAADDDEIAHHVQRLQGEVLVRVGKVVLQQVRVGARLRRDLLLQGGVAACWDACSNFDVCMAAAHLPRTIIILKFSTIPPFSYWERPLPIRKWCSIYRILWS